MTRAERDIKWDGQIDRYLRHQMDESERAAFEQEVDRDQELRQRLVATAMLAKGIAHVGMQQEGQAQLDAIKRMSPEELAQAATQVKKKSRPRWRTVKWAAGIAAAIAVVVGLYTHYPTGYRKMPEVAQTRTAKPTKAKPEAAPTQSTWASLADEYNKPFASEPDEFISIRQQIEKGNSKDMIAVVDHIEKIEWPTAKHGAKGADDGEETRYTTANFSDCTHWYKALAYLKAEDKKSAIHELNELAEHGQNDDLVERASALLEELEQ